MIFFIGNIVLTKKNQVKPNKNNLRAFLRDKNPNLPITYGYNFKIIVQKGYHSSGAGYLLSRESLNRLGSRLNKNFNSCPNTGIEDVNVAQCLRMLNVNPGKSVDELGRERFHPLSLNSYFQQELPNWMYSYSENKPEKVKF